MKLRKSVKKLQSKAVIERNGYGRQLTPLSCFARGDRISERCLYERRGLGFKSLEERTRFSFLAECVSYYSFDYTESCSVGVSAHTRRTIGKEAQVVAIEDILFRKRGRNRISGHVCLGENHHILDSHCFSLGGHV
jgi:hypothetical protein